MKRKVQEYLLYLDGCENVETKDILKNETLKEDEVQDSIDINSLYWEVVTDEVEDGWVPDMKNKQNTSHKRVPVDAADNVQGLFQCQSNCPSLAVVRLYLFDVELTVDFCNHHFNKLNAELNYTVLVDRREKVLGR